MSKSKRLAILGFALAVFVIALLMKEAYRGAPGPGRDSTVEDVTDADPRDAALPRLVDLGSDKCIPCKMMAPLLQELKQEYAGRLVVEVIDVRQNREAAAQYGIRMIPTQVFVAPSGDELFRHEGFMSKEAILAKWEELGVDIESSGS